MRRDCGLCQQCKRQGRLTPAAEVDHIVAITNGGGDQDENLEALCHDCHRTKTAADTGKRTPTEYGADGWPVTKAHHWNTGGTEKG